MQSEQDPVVCYCITNHLYNWLWQELHCKLHIHIHLRIGIFIKVPWSEFGALKLSDAPLHFNQTSSIICKSIGTLPYLKSCLEFFKVSAWDERCDNVLCEMRHVRIKYNPPFCNGVSYQKLHINRNTPSGAHNMPQLINRASWLLKNFSKFCPLTTFDSWKCSRALQLQLRHFAFKRNLSHWQSE